MLIDASSLDVHHVETKIASLLASPADVDSSGQRACEQFALALAKLFRLLPSNCQARYWDLDHFSCDFADRTET
jgi:hypothetical protein